VTPENRVLSGNQPAANIMDFVPMKNIMPFGMCTTPSNPTVASATAAASGVLTPMPCIPVTTPWKPGAPTVLLGFIPALDNTCTCQCTWGGRHHGDQSRPGHGNDPVMSTAPDESSFRACEKAGQ
jgi:hypothetical protein